GWASLRKQSGSELVGDRQNAWLHFKDGAAAKSFIDDAPQPCVVRFIHRQHVIGERSNDTWHPPSQPGKAAPFLAQGEGLTVFQHAAGRLICRRDPYFADYWKPGLNNRSGPPEPFNASGRIAKVFLTGEIH